MNKHALRVSAALVALALAAASCGSDNATSSTSVAMAPVTVSSDSTTTMAGMVDTSGAGDTVGHTHETADWPAGMDLPQLGLTTTPHADGSVDLAVDIQGFTLQSGDGSGDAPGTGHLHIMVDGRDSGMSFSPDVHLDGLSPGTHTIDIRLSNPTHGIYAVNGEPLAYSADFVIPGDAPTPDTVIEISVDENGVVGGVVDASAKLGDLVEIDITSTVAEEVHLHVYDVMEDLVPGQITRMNFTADIPGVFEAELEGPGIQILNLEVK